MKHLIKGLLREGLQEKEELEEGLLGKSFLAGLLMSVGLSWGQIKPEYKAKIDSIQKLDITPQQKRAEMMKIVQLNRNEIRGKKDEEFIRTAIVKGFSEIIDEETFALGVEEEANDKNECKNFVYRQIPNGEKVKVNLKKYRAYIKKHANDPEVGLDGLQGPDFSHTSCGISKAGAKQSKKDWSKK
jgi:hypothetical protein